MITFCPHYNSHFYVHDRRVIYQIFSAADELEPQQGIAHLTEHVAYMGSSKRERLFGTGSQTNGKFCSVTHQPGSQICGILCSMAVSQAFCIVQAF
jgi:hypothetical protein